MDGRLIDIGRIVASHGVRGEFRISPLTDFPERFSDMKTLRLFDGSGSFRLELRIESVRIRPDNGDILVRAEGISDRNQADGLRGLFVKIRSDERVDLQDDEYWIDDLLGLSIVEQETGKKIGVLCEVTSTGGGDIYSVKLSCGRVFMVPAVREYILSVDVSGGVMTVKGVRELMAL